MNSLDRLMQVNVFTSPVVKNLSSSPWHVKGCINLVNILGIEVLNNVFEHEVNKKISKTSLNAEMKAWEPAVAMLKVYGLPDYADELTNIVNNMGAGMRNFNQSVKGFIEVLHYVNIAETSLKDFGLFLPDNLNDIGYGNIWLGEATESPVEDVINFVYKNWGSGKHLYCLYLHKISNNKIFMEKTWSNNRARNNIYDCLGFYYSQVSNITQKFISGNSVSEGEIQKVLEFIDDSHVEIFCKIVSKGLFDAEGYNPPETLQAMRGMMFAAAPLSRYSDYVDLVPEWFRKMITQ